MMKFALLFAWFYTISIVFCSSDVTLPADVVRYVPCGPLTCDVTYQYCDHGRLVIRPVCSLCSDICADNRVGTIQLYIDHCLDICPVYWHLQEERLKSTTVTLATSSAAAHSASSRSSYGHQTIMVVTIIVVCLVISGVLLYFIIAKKRGTFCRPLRRSRTTDASGTQSPEIQRLGEQQHQYQLDVDLERSSDSGCGGSDVALASLLQQPAQTSTSDLVQLGSRCTGACTSIGIQESSGRSLDYTTLPSNDLPIAVGQGQVTSPKVRISCQHPSDENQISTTRPTQISSDYSHLSRKTSPISREHECPTVDTNYIPTDTAHTNNNEQSDVQRSLSHTSQVPLHRSRHSSPTYGDNTATSPKVRCDDHRRQHQPQSYAGTTRSCHRLVTNTGSGNFVNNHTETVFPVTWPNPRQPRQTPVPARDDPHGMRSDRDLPLAGTGRGRRLFDQPQPEQPEESSTTRQHTRDAPGAISEHHHPEQTDPTESQVEDSDHHSEVGTEYSPNSDYENEHVYNFIED